MDKIRTFGELLFRSRGNKPKYLIAEEVEVGIDTITSWENSVFFPSERRLPDLCRPYGLSLERLKEALVISKQARQDEKAVRKSFKPKRKLTVVQKFSNRFAGEIAPRSTLERFNSQASNYRFGRK